VKPFLSGASESVVIESQAMNLEDKVQANLDSDSRRLTSLSAVSSLLIASLAMLVAAGCSGAAPVSMELPPPEVVVGKVIRKPIVEWDEYVARLDAVETVEVRARVSGYLQSLHFEEGQIVKKGDLLCVIDSRPFEADLGKSVADVAESRARVNQSRSQLSQAEAELRSAEAKLELSAKQLERAKSLLDKKAISQDEFERQETELRASQATRDASDSKVDASKAAVVTSEANVQTMESQQAIAALNLKYTRIVAPISGRISRHMVTEGNLISGGSALSTLLTTIVSIDPIHCYFDADEKAFLKYMRLAQSGERQSSREVKNPVFVALADETTGFPHLGHMDFVDNRLDPNTATMRGRALLSNADLTLTPGLFARLRIPGSGRYEAILIPDSSVGTDQAEKFVYVVDAQCEVTRRGIVLGGMSHGLRVVRSGLDGSEQIILQGLRRVRPGIKVKKTEKTIEAADDSGLPDDYEPVPKEKWLSGSASEHESKPDEMPAASDDKAALENASEKPEEKPSPEVKESDSAKPEAVEPAAEPK
jgi:RND family efflux transporter MFP subunit